MNNQRGLFLIGTLVVALTLLACDAGSLVALVTNPTATATRTVRPTFTPRPSETPIPSDTPTPSATDTPAVTATATRKAVVSTVAPKVATALPPPPPPPQFPVSLNDGYFCEQAQSPIWKITGRINKTGQGTYFLGGYVLGVFTTDGRFLKASQPSAENGNQTLTIGGNCRAVSFYPSNAEIDVTEFRNEVPLIVRIIRSKTDRTALSKDFRADFAQPGAYFLEYTAPQ